MSKLVWLVGVGMVGVMVFAATSRGDGSSSDPSQAPPALDHSSASPGAATPLSFSIGPPEAAWTYAQLSAEEKAIADHGRDTAAWQDVNDVYARAAVEHAKESEAVMAAQLLQIGNLGEIGVVP